MIGFDSVSWDGDSDTDSRGCQKSLFPNLHQKPWFNVQESHFESSSSFDEGSLLFSWSLCSSEQDDYDARDPPPTSGDQSGNL